jgi:acyl-CoA synthetase (NDP forming)
VTRDLQPLFAPASVAVVGASADPRKWGNWLASRALRGEQRRAVHLVNHRGGDVLGRATHRSLLELEAPVDLVLITVPEAALESTVDDALAAGARAIVVISAGTEGSGRDVALGARVRDAGAVLVGPNCLGIFDAESELELASNDLPPGTIALISQSGNLGLEVSLLAQEVGLGFSRFVSLGNQADLTTAELIDATAEHELTQAIALYVEDFRDGREFARAAARAQVAGKPVVLLTVSGDEAARAIRSHTGALASDEAAIEAACSAAGIEQVSSPGQLIDVIQGLIRGVPPCGPRVAIMADGGGHGGVAASLVAKAGLQVPELSPSTVAALREQLPPSASCSNPVDLAGGGEADIRNFERVARTLLECGDVDAVLLTGYFGGHGRGAGRADRGRRAAAGRSDDVFILAARGRAAPRRRTRLPSDRARGRRAFARGGATGRARSGRRPGAPGPGHARDRARLRGGAGTAGRRRGAVRRPAHRSHRRGRAGRSRRTRLPGGAQGARGGA